MPRPTTIRGPREQCLRFKLVGYCADPKGNLKRIQNTYDFANQAGGVIPDGNKALFATNGGGTGFWDVCGASILACLNSRFARGKLWAKWISDAYDPFKIVVPGPLVGTVGLITASLPLEVACGVQKKSNISGRSWNSANHYSPLDITFAGDVANPLEELSPAGLAAFQAMRDLPNKPITDGQGNTLIPVIVSQTHSQMRINPTIIRYAEMDQANGSQLIDLNLGTLRRRQDRRVGTTG